jgi:hypothetical protein
VWAARKVLYLFIPTATLIENTTYLCAISSVLGDNQARALSGVSADAYGSTESGEVTESIVHHSSSAVNKERGQERDHKRGKNDKKEKTKKHKHEKGHKHKRSHKEKKKHKKSSH